VYVRFAGFYKVPDGMEHHPLSPELVERVSLLIASNISERAGWKPKKWSQEQNGTKERGALSWKQIKKRFKKARAGGDRLFMSVTFYEGDMKEDSDG